MAANVQQNEDRAKGKQEMAGEVNNQSHFCRLPFQKFMYPCLIFKNI
jgi:hypothetical protein